MKLGLFRMTGRRITALVAAAAVVAIPAVGYAEPNGGSGNSVGSQCESTQVPIHVKIYNASDKDRKHPQEAEGCYTSGPFASAGDRPVITIPSGSSDPSRLYFLKAYAQSGTTQVPFTALKRENDRAYVEFDGSTEAIRTYFNVGVDASPIVMEFLNQDSLINVRVNTAEPNNAVTKLVSAPKYFALDKGKGTFGVVVETNRRFDVTPHSDNPKIVEDPSQRAIETAGDTRTVLYVFKADGAQPGGEVTITFTATKKSQMRVQFDPAWRESTLLEGNSAKGLKQDEMFKLNSGASTSGFMVFKYKHPSALNAAFRDNSEYAIMKALPRGGYKNGAGADPKDVNHWVGGWMQAYDTFWGFGTDRRNDLGIPVSSVDNSIATRNTDSDFITGHDGYGGSSYPEIRNNMFMSGNENGGPAQISMDRELLGVYIDGTFVPAPKPKFNWQYLIHPGTTRAYWLYNFDNFWGDVMQPALKANNMLNDHPTNGQPAVYSDNPTINYTFKGGAHDGLKVRIVLTGLEPTLFLGNQYFDPATGEGVKGTSDSPEMNGVGVYYYMNKAIVGPNFMYTYNVILDNVKENIDIRPVWVTPNKAHIAFAKGAGIERFGFVPPKNFDTYFAKDVESPLPPAHQDSLQGWYSKDCDIPDTTNNGMSTRKANCDERMHFTTVVKNGYADPRIQVVEDHSDRASTVINLNSDTKDTAAAHSLGYNPEARYGEGPSPVVSADGQKANGKSYISFGVPVPNYNFKDSYYVDTKIMPYSDRDVISATTQLQHYHVTLDLADGQFKNSTALADFNNPNVTYDVVTHPFVSIPDRIPSKAGYIFNGYKLVGLLKGKETPLTNAFKALNATGDIKDLYRPGDVVNIRDIQLTKGNGDVQFDALKLVATYSALSDVTSNPSVYTVTLTYKKGGGVVATERMNFVGLSGLHQVSDSLATYTQGAEKTYKGTRYVVDSTTYASDSVLGDSHDFAHIVLSEAPGYTATFKADEVSHFKNNQDFANPTDKVIKSEVLDQHLTQVPADKVPSVEPAEGYKVLGWYQEGATPESALSKSQVAGVTLTGNTTFVAKTAKAYTVTFQPGSTTECPKLTAVLPTEVQGKTFTVLQGHSLKEPGSVMGADGVITALDPKLTSLGDPAADAKCTFDGWVIKGTAAPATVFTSANLIDHVFGADAEGSYTITPKYTPIPTDVTFAVDDHTHVTGHGSNTVSTVQVPQTTEHLTSEQVPLLTPADGYKVIGWFKSNAGEALSKQAVIGETISDNASFTARTKISHTVKFAAPDTHQCDVLAYTLPESLKTTYTVLDGGTLAAPGSVMSPEDGSISSLPALASVENPTDTNCTFTGWSISDGSGQPATVPSGQSITSHSFTADTSKTFTVTPVFEKTPVTITFETDVQGQTLTETSRQVFKGYPIGKFPTLNGDAYVIDHWYDKADSHKTPVENVDSLKATDAKTYVAVLKKIHTVTLHLNEPTYAQFPGDQSGDMTLRVIDGQKISQRLGTEAVKASDLQPVLTAEGQAHRVLEGWHKADAAAGSPALTTEALLNEVVTGDVTYNFSVTPKEHTVKFTTSEPTVTLTGGDDRKVLDGNNLGALPTSANPDWVIKCWYPEGEPDNCTHFADGATTTFTITKDVTYVAQLAKLHTVTLKVVDGTHSTFANDAKELVFRVVDGNEFKDVHGAAALTENNIKVSLTPAGEGNYTLSGWKKANALGQPEGDYVSDDALLKHKVTADETYLFILDRVTHTVKFTTTVPGQTLDPSTDRVVGNGDEVGTLPTLSSTGEYVIEKWYVQGDPHENAIDNTYVVNSDVTLVAKLAKIHTVTLHLADSTHSEFPNNKTDDIVLKVVNGKTIAARQGDNELTAAEIQPVLSSAADGDYTLGTWTQTSPAPSGTASELTTEQLLTQTVTSDVTYTFSLNRVTKTVTFETDPAGQTLVNGETRTVNRSEAIGPLPTLASNDHYVIVKWYEKNDPQKTEVTAATVVKDNMVLVAELKKVHTVVLHLSDPSLLKFPGDSTSDITLKVVDGTTIADRLPSTAAKLTADEIQPALQDAAVGYYNLEGWRVQGTSGAALSTADLLTQTITADVTYDFSVTHIQDTVTFVTDPADQALNNGDPRTINRGDKVGELPTLTSNDQYVIAKWYVQGDDTEKAVDANYVVNKSVTLVAKLDKVHTVTLRLADKTHSTYPDASTDDLVVKVVDGQKLTNRLNGAQLTTNDMAPQLTADASGYYTLVGWQKLGANGKPEGPVLTNAELLNTEITGDATYVFTLDRVKVNVTFVTDPEGKELVGGEARSVIRGERLGDLPTLADPHHFTIIKWYEKGDSAQTPVTADTEVDHSMTVVAEVKALHTVTLRLADKTHSTYPDASTGDLVVKVVDGQKLTNRFGGPQLTTNDMAPQLTADASGYYTLVGWQKLGANGKPEGPVLTNAQLLNTEITGDATYVFTLDRVKVNVTFATDPEGQQLVGGEERSVIRGERVGDLPTLPQNAEYVISKWYVKGDPDETAVDASYEVDHAVTLVAKLTKIDTITLRLADKERLTFADGSTDDKVIKVVNGEKLLDQHGTQITPASIEPKLVDSAKKGYDLDGWYEVNGTTGNRTWGGLTTEDLFNRLAEGDAVWEFRVKHVLFPVQFLDSDNRTPVKTIDVERGSAISSVADALKNITVKDLPVRCVSPAGAAVDSPTCKAWAKPVFADKWKKSLDKNAALYTPAEVEQFVINEDLVLYPQMKLVFTDKDGKPLSGDDAHATTLRVQAAYVAGDHATLTTYPAAFGKVGSKLSELIADVPTYTAEPGYELTGNWTITWTEEQPNPQDPKHPISVVRTETVTTAQLPDYVVNAFIKIAPETRAKVYTVSFETNNDKVGLKNGDSVKVTFNTKIGKEPTSDKIAYGIDYWYVKGTDPKDPANQITTGTLADHVLTEAKDVTYVAAVSLLPDMDHDGIPDAIDTDIDGDGINNSDEIAAGLDPRNPDTNGDGIPDGDEDSDGDGIPNKDESNPNLDHITDENGNGKADLVDPSYPDPSKKDAKPTDTDGDGIPDYRDTDIDGDGVNNADEIAAGMDPRNPDTNGDGVKDGDEDCDGDGVPNKDESDPSLPHITDKNDNGKADLVDPSYPDPSKKDAKPTDTDGDGVPDYKDTDKDGDGVNNADEIAAGLDPAKADTDGNGVPDGDEDSDGDGVLNKDESDPSLPHITDKDHNGKADLIDPDYPTPGGNKGKSPKDLSSTGVDATNLLGIAALFGASGLALVAYKRRRREA